MSSTARAVAGRPTAGVFGAVRAWTLAVCVATAIWAVALCYVVRGAYTDFRLGRFDLGNMVQAIWSTTQGRPLEMTDGSTGEQVTRLGTHVDPFLVLLAPVWAIWPSPLSLAFAQVLIVSLGALPVFWLARRRLESERVAGLLALAYLAYPWIAISAVAAIHPVTFAIPLLLFCVWFLETDRLVPFAICAVLVASTGELMGLPVAGLGVWYALAHGKRLAGAVIALAGVVWTFVAVYVVVGHFSGDSSVYYGFYDEIGGSPQGVVRKLFSDPRAVLGALFEAHDVVYVVWLGVPLLFLFLLAPGIALVGLPQLLANTLSDFRSMSDPRYHSIAAIVPFLLAATIFGIARMRPANRALAASAVLMVSAVLALAVGPWTRVVGGVPLGGRESLTEAKLEALHAGIALVPHSAPVTSSPGVGARLSARRHIYTVPMLGSAEWAVVDLDEPWVVRPDSPILTQHPKLVRGLARRLDRDSQWTKVFEREGVLVFRRGA